MAVARTVIETNEVARIIDAEIKRIPRLHDVYEGLKWRIARDPDSGYPVSGTRPPRRVMRSDEYRSIPGVLVVAYTFGENEAEIVGVRLETPGAAAAIKLA